MARATTFRVARVIVWIYVASSPAVAQQSRRSESVSGAAQLSVFGSSEAQLQALVSPSSEPTRLTQSVANRIAGLVKLAQSPEVGDAFSAYGGLCEIARQSTNVLDAQAAVSSLARIFDHPVVGGHAYDYLGSFTSDLFTDETRQYLRAKLHESDIRRRCYSALVFVVGVADMKDELSYLRTLVSGFPCDSLGRLRWTSVEWAAACACARMGDAESTTDCVKAVSEQRDKDFVAQYLLADLAYVRQPEAVALISEYLFSDMATQPGSSDVKPVRYAKFAVDALRGTLTGFPALPKVPISQTDDITACRRWMSEQKRFEFIK